MIHHAARPLNELEALYHRTNIRRLAAWERVIDAARVLIERGGTGHAYVDVMDHAASSRGARVCRRIWRLYRASHDRDGPGGVTWDGEGLSWERPVELVEHEAAQELCRRIGYGTDLNGRWLTLGEELDRRFAKKLREVYPILYEKKSQRAVVRTFPVRVHVNGRDYWYRERRTALHMTVFGRFAWFEEQAEILEVCA